MCRRGQGLSQDRGKYVPSTLVDFKSKYKKHATDVASFLSDNRPERNTARETLRRRDIWTDKACQTEKERQRKWREGEKGTDKFRGNPNQINYSAHGWSTEKFSRYRIFFRFFTYKWDKKKRAKTETDEHKPYSIMGMLIYSLRYYQESCIPFKKTCLSSFFHDSNEDVITSNFVAVFVSSLRLQLRVSLDNRTCQTVACSPQTERPVMSQPPNQPEEVPAALSEFITSRIIRCFTTIECDRNQNYRVWLGPDFGKQGEETLEFMI